MSLFYTDNEHTAADVIPQEYTDQDSTDDDDFDALMEMAEDSPNQHDQPNQSNHSNNLNQSNQLNNLTMMPSFSFEPTRVVLDLGSGVLKSGFAGEEYPSVCFPTIVGTDKVYDEQQWIQQKKNNDIFYEVGQEALDRRMELQLSYPIRRGQIESFIQMEFIFENLFSEKLQIETETTHLLLSELPLQSLKTKETLAEILFETFSIHGFQMMLQSMLSLYSTGRTTGLVVDCGDQVSCVTPIYEGYLVDHAIERLNLGGRDVTQYLQTLMLHRGYDFQSSGEHQFAREIKESLGFVSVEHCEDIDRPESDFEKIYELPDGSEISLGYERFNAPELLFDPMRIGREAAGLSELTYKSFSQCGYDIRNALYKQIVLVGGCSLFEGLGDRLIRDLNRREKSFRTFRVEANEMRQFSSWIGGSVIASLDTFSKGLIYLHDYDEEGVRVMHRLKRQ